MCSLITNWRAQLTKQPDQCTAVVAYEAANIGRMPFLNYLFKNEPKFVHFTRHPLHYVQLEDDG
jgi:hypothetical protein